MAASYEMTGHHRAAYDLAIRAMQPLYGTTTLVKVNDLRGHAAVLALFDEVIAVQRLASIEAIEHDLDEGRPLVALIEPRIPQFEMHGAHADRLIADREEIEEQIAELQVR